MEYSTLFARHFTRLVWLLLHEPANVNEQKSTLRAMVALSKFGAIGIESRDWQVMTEGVALPDSTSGATELVAQMAVHGIRAIRFGVGPAPAHILGVARLLATRPGDGDPGQAAIAHLKTIGATSITVVLDEAVTVGRSNGTNGSSAGAATKPKPSASDTTPNRTTTDTPAPTAPMPEAPRATAAPEPVSSAPPENGTPGGGASAPQSDFVHDDGMWMQFSATQAPAGSVEELFSQLDRYHRSDAVTRVLDDLVITAENAAREGKSNVVADVFHGIVRREGAVTDEGVKRAYTMAIRRMSRPALLRAVAQLLPRKRERRPDYLAVLVRAGEDGADALIEQLTQAQAAEDRRVFFDMLLHLQAGVPALIHMLGDARWFVARNAAELLGEMKAADAEEPLKQLLRHHDDRVRRSATNALVALESPTARKAVSAAMKDASPQVRMQAAAALSKQRDEKTSGTLTRALDDEVDPEVQLAIIAALGRVATSEAVQRLIKAAEPDSRFFKKKATAMRVAAVQALGEARTPAAMAAVFALVEDKEREVREAAQRLVIPSGRAR
jgi:HEAT repeat protein